MAHAQKPDFVFRRNGRVDLNRQGASVQTTVGSRGVRIGVSNAGYTIFRGTVRVLATHSIYQFSLHFPPVSHRVPSGFKRTLPFIHHYRRRGHHHHRLLLQLRPKRKHHKLHQVQ